METKAKDGATGGVERKSTRAWASEIEHDGKKIFNKVRSASQHFTLYDHKFGSTKVIILRLIFSICQGKVVSNNENNQKKAVQYIVADENDYDVNSQNVFFFIMKEQIRPSKNMRMFICKISMKEMWHNFCIFESVSSVTSV